MVEQSEDVVRVGDLWILMYLLSVVLRDARFLSQLMLACGIPSIWHWKRATPPSSTLMDTGWVWNFGRAEEQTTTRISLEKSCRRDSARLRVNPLSEEP